MDNNKSIFANVASVFLISFMYLNFFNAYASDVVVESETDIGRGILRSVGGSCFIYTPQHVAENSAGIVYVSSSQVRDRQASVLTSFPVDLALLKLPDEDNIMCDRSSWQDEGERVGAILEIQKNGILSLRKKSGGLSDLNVRFSSKDLHSFFYIQPMNASQKIRQGMSGSIVYVATYPVGMLVSVEDGRGKVLRIDTIANISKTVLSSYVGEIERIANASSDKSAFPSLNKKGSSILHAPLSSKEVFKDSIGEKQQKEHKFVTRGHTAFKLKMKRQSESARVSVSILGPGGDRLGRLRNVSTNKDNRLGFGTIDAGEHTLLVDGVNGVGIYHIELEEVASPEQLVGEANIISDGDSVSGYIAQKTYAEYQFITRGHTAFKLKMKHQSEAVSVSVSALNPAGDRLGRLRNISTKSGHVLGFGTVDAGEHAIRIDGVSGVGTYHLELEEVASPEQLVGDENVISFGDSVSGYIANNTYAEYRFVTRGHTAFKLQMERQSESAAISVAALSPSGKRLGRLRNIKTGSGHKLGFGTVDAGEHIIRIEGIGGVGTYHLKLKEVATPEQLVGEANIINVGDSASGYIAQNTYAEYRFISRGNKAFKLKMKRQSEAAKVNVSVLDPSGKRLGRLRNLLTNKGKELEFGTVVAGEYIVRIEGLGGVGVYHLTLE